MEIVMRQISEVKPYGKNPRRNDGAVDAVAASIREFGFKQPIVVDTDGVIIVGHTRFKAAKKLGLKEVPVCVADDLSPEKVKAYRLADNKTGELAEWDEALLKAELEDLGDIDMEQFGFNTEAEEEVCEEPEVAFTEELREEHNYVVLYFDNDVDWLQAQSLFDISPKHALSTRKDGKNTRKKFGVGRVLNGAKALERLLKK